MLRSDDIESANERPVDRRRDEPASHVLAEYERWSARG